MRPNFTTNPDSLLYPRRSRERPEAFYRRRVLAVFFGLWCVGSMATFPLLEPQHRVIGVLPWFWCAVGGLAGYRGHHLDLWAALGVGSFSAVVAIYYLATGMPSPYVLALVPVVAAITGAPGGVALWSGVTLVFASGVLVAEANVFGNLPDWGLPGAWTGQESFSFLLVIALTSLCLSAVDAFNSVSARQNREYARRFRAVAEESYQGILEFAPTRGDPLRGLRYANGRVAELLGFTNAELQQRNWALNDWIHPHDRAVLLEFVAHAYKSEDSRRCRFRARHRSGHWIWLEATQFRAFRAEDGAYRRVVTLRDVSEEKRVQERRFEAQRLESLGVLAGGVAHDFNNLLTVILGHLEDIPDPEARDEVEQATEQARELTAQLLASGRKQLRQPEVFDLGERVASHRGMIRTLIGGAVELELDTQSGNVEADPQQLAQVLLNLVANARDAMPEGGTLTLQVHRIAIDAGASRDLGIPPGAYLRLRVRDDGIGMDDATRERAFDPFFSTKERHAGTGLGLSSVYGILEQSRGHIRVTSALGEGTEVDVYLPESTRDPTWFRSGSNSSPTRRSPRPHRSKRSSASRRTAAISISWSATSCCPRCAGPSSPPAPARSATSPCS